MFKEPNPSDMFMAPLHIFSLTSARSMNGVQYVMRELENDTISKFAHTMPPFAWQYLKIVKCHGSLLKISVLTIMKRK